MKLNLLAPIGVLALLSGAATAVEKNQPSKPNIIYINVDDLGWNELGYTGSQFFESPNIDKLATQSMKFTAGYAPAANCAPSRAACLSGQWGPRTGVYTVMNSTRGKASERKLIPTKNTLHLEDSNPTIGTILHAAGYETATMGKWHVTKDPLKNGFDVNIAGSEDGSPNDGGYLSPFHFPNLVVKEEGVYLTDRLTDEAIKFITKPRKSPFFLYLPYFTVHTPLQPKPEKVAYFKQKAERLFPRKGNKSGKPKQGEATRYELGAMVSSLDENIGRILKTLKESGLEENTLIIFTSDNGGIWAFNGEHALRAGKGSYYEGGIRVPLLISWKGKIKPGTCELPVSGIDFFPTLADAANASIPKEKVLDGDSLMPVLLDSDAAKTGKKISYDRPLFWHFPIYLAGGNKDCQDSKFRTRPGSAIRIGDWKLIQYFENGDLELYNLKKDPKEKHNVSEENPEKTQLLLKTLKSWRAKTKAPVPSELNPKFGKSAKS